MIKKGIPAILLLLLLNQAALFAQKGDDYSKNWKEVENLEKKGFTASALTEVVNIFNLAFTSGNEAQQIKAVMFQIKYRNMTEENSIEKNILYIDTLIEKTKTPAKNLLQSMQAELLWNYRRQNSYRLYNRTELVEEKSTDIATWTIQKLNKTITALYKASLTNNVVLKSTSLNGWDAILQKGTNSRDLRPTVYDFIAHRALNFFMSTENDVTNPSYKFILNDEYVLSPAKTFIRSSFITKDSGALYYNAILLLQDILKFHIDDPDPAAFIDADLIRLGFANQHAVIPGKDSLYEIALKNIEETHKSSSWAAQAMFLRAKLYYDHGQLYHPINNKTPQFDIKKAKELCEETINNFPNAFGALNAQNLLSIINGKLLKIQTEKVNIPEVPFKSMVQYKNVPKIYIRVIKTSREEIKKIAHGDYNKSWQLLTNLTAIKSWSIHLPDQQDYQQHTTEIKIDALPSGTYIILTSVSPDFNLNNNLLNWQATYVSNIGFIMNDKNDLYVLDRNNGVPLANAELQIWQQKYNYTSRGNDEIKLLNYVTDKNGYVKIKKTKNDNYYVYYQIKHRGDELFTDDTYYNYEYDSYENPTHTKTFLFTDRSIYRPGQNVFFKGIVVKKDITTNKNTVAPNYKANILLYDVNNQIAGRLSLMSNEYGSYNGNFKLPENGLNGQFYIKDSSNESIVEISVEEYKRPKFSVDIKKPKGTYRINDSVYITGIAKAYAGNNIDAAKVIYRVVRKVQYPIWFGWYRKTSHPFGRSESQEITNGETITDNKGEFSISFKAIPDEKVDKKNQPVFYYEVTADITDVNGETRNGNVSVAVSYQALKLNIIAETKIDADSLKKVKISSRNMNELFEKATVQVSIQKLQSPNRIFRQRFWETPDQFTMTKEEFTKNFPYDSFSDENEIEKWPVEKTELVISDTTTENSVFNFHGPSLPVGWYKIMAITKDKYGEEVKAEKFIQLTNKLQNTKEDPIIIDATKNPVEPAEKINYSITTGFENIWVIHTVNKMNKITSTIYPTIKNSSAFTNELNTTEEDRGGINISCTFVKHNRVYNETINFIIPWSNKDLKIQYETFRDKILPGSDEKWKIKISGSKSEKVAAESLISMYDAALDQFKPHNWQSIKSIWPVLSNDINWNSNTFAATNSITRNTIKTNRVNVPFKSYDRLLSSDWNNDYRDRNDDVVYSWQSSGNISSEAAARDLQEVVISGLGKENKVGYKKQGQFAAPKVVKDEEKTSEETTLQKNPGEEINEHLAGNNHVQVRKNFNETGFFLPILNTDPNGNIQFSFTIPEALTTWKMMTLAHTKELASIYDEKTVITQKPLMVQPNAPRFFREGDRMEFSAKIVNLSDSEITGTAQLELLDAATNKPVDGWFKNVFPVQYFTVAAGQSSPVKFPVEIPFSFNSALTYRIKASSKDGSFSDGEEAALPVLTNRMLVTETMPLNMRSEATKNFKFEKLLNSNNSGSLTNHGLTVEYTSNPAWYAVQALPYLMEFPYECAEQNFNRYYANSLASFVSNSTPKIKAVFEKWKTSDTTALLSNLQKNEELKSALLQETPWVLAAQNESQQKKNIAILFDMVRLAKEKDNILEKLKDLQTSNGGFSWFKGGRDDRYITQYILAGIGHLRKLKALNSDDYNKVKPIIETALPYLDARLKEEYDNLKKYKANLKNNNLSYTAIQYLYMRSFFPEYEIKNNTQTAFNYFRNQSQQYWLSQNKYMQAMIALALYRTEDKKTPNTIISSLKENAIYQEEMGMYFKDIAAGGYYWYQSPVESQSMIIEAFSDIDKNNSTVDDLKTWLLKQKQTQNWKTTKATAEACYALLLNGNNWLTEDKEVTINVGNTVIRSDDNNPETGTGYFKKTIPGDKVQQGMGNIAVNITTSPNQQLSKSTSWGAVYWQYFEDLDKISSSETPLKLVKKLFIEKNSDTGPVLQPLNDGDELHIGDKVKIRIELKVDRDMEYIHMKDMRASCMEPVNVISQYKWQGGLGYYESTKDASTNFFFGWLPRGTYVFEYPMFVTHSGNFSNGITSIQCMYAPEFSSHSNGIRVNVQ